jgi:hypothetical protein
MEINKEDIFKTFCNSYSYVIDKIENGYVYFHMMHNSNSVPNSEIKPTNKLIEQIEMGIYTLHNRLIMTKFNYKVYSIFKRLEYYQINDSIPLLNDVIIEKEEIRFVVRIIYKNENEIVSEYEIDNFNESISNHYKIKGYLITNTLFNIDYSNNLYIYDGRIRLFDINEIERLFKKLLHK